MQNSSRVQETKSFPSDLLRKPYTRRVLRLKFCPHNHRLACKANISSPCPLSSQRFTALLDHYCERAASRPSPDCSQISGKGDPMRQSTPPTMLLEVASWFDNRQALESYAAWRRTNRPLRMDADLCRGYTDAYAHWWARLQPLGVRRPGTWMRGRSDSEWARIANLTDLPSNRPQADLARVGYG